MSTALEDVFRREAGRCTATLVRVLGDLDLAEESVAETFAIAAGKSRHRVGRRRSVTYPQRRRGLPRDDPTDQATSRTNGVVTHSGAGATRTRDRTAPSPPR